MDLAAPSRTPHTTQLITLVAWIFPVVVFAFLAWPKPVPPFEMPSFVRSQFEVSDLLPSAVHPRTMHATDGIRRERRGLYADANRLEARTGHTPNLLELQRTLEQRLHEKATAILASSSDSLRQDRREDVEACVRRLRSLPETEKERDLRDAWCGTFPRLMSEYTHFSSTTQTSVAALRSLLLVRWNQMHGLDRFAGLAREQERDFWTWVGLEADRTPPEVRIQALGNAHQLQGSLTSEAVGFFHLARGDFRSAEFFFQHAAEISGSWRMRNHALSVHERRLQEDAALP